MLWTLASSGFIPQVFAFPLKNCAMAHEALEKWMQKLHHRCAMHHWTAANTQSIRRVVAETESYLYGLVMSALQALVGLMQPIVPISRTWGLERRIAGA